MLLSECFFLKEVRKGDEAIGYTAGESFQFRRLKKSVSKNLKTLGEALSKQRAIVALLGDTTPDCFENVQFQNELTLLEGYKARLQKEIAVERRVKWIESFGQSIAVKIAHSIYEQTKNNAFEHYHYDSKGSSHA